MAKSMKEKEYLEVDIMQLLYALWHRAWAIVLAVIVCGAAFFCGSSFLMKPEYTARTMLYVNNSSLKVGEVSISPTELNAAQSLVNTYVVILKSRSVLEDVIAQTGVTYSYSELKSMVSAHPVDSTEIFEVEVTSYDAGEAEKIANAISEVLKTKIQEIVEGSSVRIVDPAVKGTKSGPNVTMYTAVGMLLGAFLSCGLILLLQLFDQYIRSEEYLLQTFDDIPVLAVIPDLDSGSSKNNYYYGNRSKGE